MKAEEITVEEAIEVLRNAAFLGTEEMLQKDRDAVEMAIDDLKKQIPKKPKKYIAFDGIERNGCPSCTKNEILYAGQKYCSVCGQAIDWSEVEK